MDEFNHYLTQPLEGLSEADLEALQITPNDKGRFVVAPQEFAKEMTRYLDNMLFIRRFASKSKMSGMASPASTAFNANSDFEDEKSETAILSSRRELRPQMLVRQVKISKKLFEKGKMPPYKLVAERLGYWIGLAQQKEFLVGTGSGQPLGVFTPSAAGISSERDYIAASASSLVASDFTGALAKLDAQNRAEARWIIHPDILMLAMKLKDSSGRPLYDENPTSSVSPTLAGAPFIMSQYASNTITTGQYVAVVGDLSGYGIAEAMEHEVQARIELHPANNKNSYVGRTMVDGMPLLEDAFVRLRMA
jgi:HK97 family phage major capsid protein